MVKEELKLLSEFDGWELKGVLLIPEGSPKGIVQLVHGMTEHKYRYRDLMNFLVEKGYVVVAHDHRGHGESVQNDEDLGWFGDDTSKAIVEDCVQVTKYVRERFPNLPLTLYGHSMCSLVVRCYIRDYDEYIDKLVVSGSPSVNPMLGGAIRLTGLLTKVYGPRHRSNLLRFLTTGKGDAQMKNKGGGSWLTRDTALAEASKKDPKCGYAFTCNSGGDDAVMENEMKWMQAIEVLREAGYTNVTGKLYEGMRHEIHNELDRELVFADVLAFLEK